MGCLGDPEPLQVVPPERPFLVQQGESEPAVALGDELPPVREGVPVEVAFQWTGVGGLHQGYFLDVEAVGVLKRELGKGLSGGRLVVEVAWDNEQHRGTIRAHVPRSMVPGGLQLASGGAALSRLVPMTRALAEYRDHVAGRFDVRVLSFHLEVEVAGRCRVSAGGDYPPDGTSLKSCVVVDKKEFCGTPVPGGVLFGSINEELTRCFADGP